MLHRRGEVALIVGDSLSWARYDLDKPFVRITPNPVLRG
jgi:hypothetical protein